MEKGKEKKFSRLVVCSYCGDFLSAYEDEDGDIIVSPCRRCLGDSYNDGYERGYDNGYDDCLETEED